MTFITLAMDRFDEIWRNKFQQEDILAEKWNTPSERVWNNVQESLSTKGLRRRRPMFLLIFLFGFFILSGAAYYFSSFKRDSHLGPAPNNTPFSLHDSQNDQKIVLSGFPGFDSEIETTIINKEVEYDQEKLAKSLVEESEPGGPLRTNGPSLSDTEGSTARINNLLRWGIDMQSNGINGSTEATGMTGSKSELTFIVSDDIEIIHSNLIGELKSGFISHIESSASITALPIRNISYLDFGDSGPFLLKNFDWQPSTFNKGEVGSSKWGIGVLGGISIWDQKVSGAYTGDLSPFNFNYRKRASGWSGGIQLTRNLNDYLSISTALVYEKVQGNSGHSSSLLYSPHEEDPIHSNQGYEIGIATPFGFASAEFLLNRKEFIGQDPVDLLADFESKHSIENISIPIYFKINPLVKTNGINTLLSVGMGFNRVVSITNSLIQVDPNHSAFEYQNINTRFELKDEINLFHLDLRLGLDVELPIIEHYDLSFGVTSMFGLDKIFDSGDYYTRVNRIWIQAALRRSFGKK